MNAATYAAYAEYDALRVQRWSANKAYGSSNSANGLNDANRHKECLWFSKFCLNQQPMLLELT